MDLQYNKTIPVKKIVDILVVGGSQSGVAAAISAKRASPNLHIMLAEQSGYLGGQSVGNMVCHYEFREYTNNKGRVLARGIGKEIIRRVVDKGHSDPLYSEWLNGQGPPFKTADGRAMADIPLDLEDLKLVLQEMCDEAKVEVILFAKLADVIADTPKGKSMPNYLIFASLEGLFAVQARRVVDCTGNNDVAWLLGKENVAIPPNPVMPMQTYAWFGGVDIEKFASELWNHRDWWQTVYPDNKDQMIRHIREGKTMAMRGASPYLDFADEKFPGILAELEQYCRPIIYYWLKPVKIFSYPSSAGMYYDSWWAIEGPTSIEPQTNADCVSKFQQAQLRAVHIMQKIHSLLPGWEHCFVVRTADRPGFRQTRVLKGVYRLQAKDIRQNAQFHDRIGRGSGHDFSRGKHDIEAGYDIPYRALMPTDIDNLTVGARSISCDIDDGTLTALNAHRGISATIICSQAAGVAAALSLIDNVTPRELDIKKLQTELIKQDVVL